FKTLYSEIHNDQYNHWYKMSKKYSNAWDNISYDMKWIKKNVCNFYPNFENVEVLGEDDLHSMFGSSLNNSSVNVSSINTSSANASFVNASCVKRSADDAGTGTDANSFKMRKMDSNEVSTKSNVLKENDHCIPLKKSDLENVSDGELSDSFDESTIINNIVLVDEVGEVDLSNFEDMIKRVNGQCN
ncbi:MAG TPA: hypothetical protein VGC17_01710, partial [Lactovum miscens]|uniref:hypothetical protein n=1 Tax=Lactovum miscens TaxID=190387 RepID=UPI002ED9E54C